MIRQRGIALVLPVLVLLLLVSISWTQSAKVNKPSKDSCASSLASSTESMGEFRLRQLPQLVVQSDLHDVVGSKTTCFSDGQFCIGVQPFHDTTGYFTLGSKPVEKEFPMTAQCPHEFLHRVEA